MSLCSLRVVPLYEGGTFPPQKRHLRKERRGALAPQHWNTLDVLLEKWNPQNGVETVGVVAQEVAKYWCRENVYVHGESASCCPLGLQDISRKDISASCPDSPLLPPSPLSFPTLCVEWRSLALADGKNRISHRSNSIICVSGSFFVVAIEGGNGWFPDLTFISFSLSLTTMTGGHFSE